jgi:single-stranded-DNA-specific exonuclease
LTLPVEDLEAFKARFEALARETLTPEHLRRHLRVDAEVALTEVSTEMLATLRLLAPYGKGNPEPLLMARNVHVRQSRVIGKDRTHLKMQVEAGLWSLDAIAFGMAALAPEPGARVDLLFRPELNEFRGTTTLQLQVKALRPAQVEGEAG